MHTGVFANGVWVPLFFCGYVFRFSNIKAVGAHRVVGMYVMTFLFSPVDTNKGELHPSVSDTAKTYRQR